MSKRIRHTYLQNLLAVMNYCRTPKTMHAVKDKFSFSNEKLKKVIADLQNPAYISISELPRDGRHVKQIITTDLGKAQLAEQGIKY